jgi:hypothetical protein
MSSPHEEIESFLVTNRTDPKRRLVVALEFARCMSQELRAILSQWEAAEEALERIEDAARPAVDISRQ